MERRRAARHDVQLPVLMERGEGLTRDMSVSGVRFETPAFDLPVGHPFDFSVTIGRHETGSWTLRCHGLVIRVESRGGRFTVAAEIDRFLEIRPNNGRNEFEH